MATGVRCFRQADGRAGRDKHHPLSTTSYNVNGTVQRVIFGNNSRVDYVYDGFKQLTGVKYDGASAARFTYVYGSNGEVAQVTDNVRGRIIRSEYDLANRPCRKTIQTTSGGRIYEAAVRYNAYGNLSRFKETVAEAKVYTTNFTYDNESKPILLTYGNGQRVEYTYDTLGRSQKRKGVKRRQPTLICRVPMVRQRR